MVRAIHRETRMVMSSADAPATTRGNFALLFFVNVYPHPSEGKTFFLLVKHSALRLD